MGLYLIFIRKLEWPINVSDMVDFVVLHQWAVGILTITIDIVGIGAILGERCMDL